MDERTNPHVPHQIPAHLDALRVPIIDQRLERGEFGGIDQRGSVDSVEARFVRSVVHHASAAGLPTCGQDVKSRRRRAIAKVTPTVVDAHAPETNVRKRHASWTLLHDRIDRHFDLVSVDVAMVAVPASPALSKRISRIYLFESAAIVQIQLRSVTHQWGRQAKPVVDCVVKRAEQANEQHLEGGGAETVNGRGGKSHASTQPTVEIFQFSG